MATDYENLMFSKREADAWVEKFLEQSKLLGTFLNADFSTLEHRAGLFKADSDPVLFGLDPRPSSVSRLVILKGRQAGMASGYALRRMQDSFHSPFDDVDLVPEKLSLIEQKKAPKPYQQFNKRSRHGKW